MHKKKMKHNLMFLLFTILLAACQPSTMHGATPTLTSLPFSTLMPTSSPAPTEKPSPTPQSADIAALFSAKPDFAQAVLAQDTNAAEDFTQVGDKYYRTFAYAGKKA